MGYSSTFQPFLFVLIFVQKSLQKIEENKGYFRKTVKFSKNKFREILHKFDHSHWFLVVGQMEISFLFNLCRDELLCPPISKALSYQFIQ
jgi:hypothetical protein